LVCCLKLTSEFGKNYNYLRKFDNKFNTTSQIIDSLIKVNIKINL